MSSRSQPRNFNINRLPPINKHLINHKIHNNKVKGIQLSLQLLNHSTSRSRPKILSNGSHPRINYKQSHKRIDSHRQRIDSAGSQLNKYPQHKSFDVDILDKKDSDKTLQNFHKNVMINKQYIHREMRKRKLSKKRAQTQSQAKQNSVSKLSQQKDKLKVNMVRRSVTEQNAIFQDIQGIINSRMINSNQQKLTKQKLNLSNIRQLIKISKINKNIRKLSPEKPISQLKKHHEQFEKINPTSEKIILKDSNNYHEWRRVQLNSNYNSPKYKVSTFEEQNQRLGKFIKKNQICLSKYFQFRQQLVMCHSTKVKTNSS